MEVLSEGRKTRIQNLDGPQKPLVFYDEPKAELQTSEINIIPLKIQLYSKTCSREKYEEGKQTKQETGLAERGGEG